MSFHKISAKRKSPKANRCILLLWGEYFDEVAATVFTVTLRKAGLCVKVVGVNGLFATGCNGLVLHADLALSEIAPLVDDMVCLILPCGHAAIKCVENDPLLHTLLAAAVKRQTKFVLSDTRVIKNSGLDSRAISSKDIATYAQEGDLIVFAKDVATTLTYFDKASYRRPTTLMQPID